MCLKNTNILEEKLQVQTHFFLLKKSLHILVCLFFIENVGQTSKVISTLFFSFSNYNNAMMTSGYIFKNVGGNTRHKKVEICSMYIYILSYGKGLFLSRLSGVRT